MIFGDWAQKYYDMGLVPLPLGKPSSGTRGAQAAFTRGWQKCARDRYDQNTLDDYINRFGDRNIGIACGTILYDDLQLVGIDVDNEDYLENVERAMPFTLSAKRGSKGVTWFAMCPSDIGTKRVVNKEGTIVDFLAVGSQTVIPPSIHPKIDAPYEWVGEPLHTCDLKSLPIVTKSFLLELNSIVAGKGQYFVGGELEDGEEITGINSMVWNGVGGGGNTYDSRLRCIAHMVATGWEDEEIVARIRRAQREAVEQAGETLNWPDCERETQQQIDDARKKSFDTTAKKSKIPVERIWAEWLNTQYDYPIYYAGINMSYEEGYYRQIEEQAHTSLITRTFPTATAPRARTAYNTYCDLSYRNNFGAEAKDKICMLNGTLEIESQILRPWSSDDELLYRLDIEWDDDSDCPEYDKFVKWVFMGDEDSIQCWNEFCGLSLVDNISYQKALFLLGPGANGKSTLAGILNDIHESSMVSTVAITELDNERRVTSLVGKLLNISSEQSRITAITDNVFKQITGGDPITIRRLFKEAENNIILKVRFLCLANDLPSMQDPSEAMRRRLIILKCDNKIEDDAKDVKLKERVLKEKSGILRRWVTALNSLNSRGEFVEPESSKDAVDKYISQSDPIGQWVSLKMQKVDVGQSVDIHLCYMDFAEWAKAVGYQRPSAMVFWSRSMERLGFVISEKIVARKRVQVINCINSGSLASTGTEEF